MITCSRTYGTCHKAVPAASTQRVYGTCPLPAMPCTAPPQLPLSYQPADELYCVRAVYEPINATDLTAGLIVNNYANRGAVNGPVSGTSRYDPWVNAMAR